MDNKQLIEMTKTRLKEQGLTFTNVNANNVRSIAELVRRVEQRELRATQAQNSLDELKG